KDRDGRKGSTRVLCPSSADFVFLRCVSDRRSAIPRLSHAGRAAWKQGKRGLRDRRRNSGSRCGPDHRPDRTLIGSGAARHLCRGKSLNSSHWDHIRTRVLNKPYLAGSVIKGGKQFRGLAADSREVQPGFLFAALSGSRTDGARFVEDAVKRGAVAVLGTPELADTAKLLGVQFIPSGNPRQALARLAADFYQLQPSTIAAVTGTNGKTSVAAFIRQIWMFQGRKAASLGTVGIDSPLGHVRLAHTTPDPVRLHAELARLKEL